jgi:hypothetical protein
MTMPDSELRRLLRMPLQAFGNEVSSDTPGQASVRPTVALRAKRIAASHLRICFSPAHDISHLLHEALELVPPKDRRPVPEPSDLRGREFRRLLRTWTPQSHVDIAVHPANLRYLPPDGEILVSGLAPGLGHDGGMSHDVSLALLAAPLSGDAVSRVMAALVTHLATTELRGAARRLHQKRLSRNAFATSGTSAGPQPATPAGRLLAATRRQLRGPNLRPAPYRVLPARRSIHFAPA